MLIRVRIGKPRRRSSGSLPAAVPREPRATTGIRSIIGRLQSAIDENRRHLTLELTRTAELQADVDRRKKHVGAVLLHVEPDQRLPDRAGERPAKD
jgi:hypothetical protein